MGRIVRVMSLFAGILGLGTIFLTAGCGSGGGTRLRVMNAVPDEANLNVLVDNSSVSSSLAYGTSTGYISEGSGSHQVAVAPTGSNTALLTQTVNLASGSDTTIISTNFSTSIENLVLTDNNTAPASGDFTIRLINASPNLGPADIYIVAPGTALTTVSPTLSNVGFGVASSYQSLTAGNLEIEMTSVGQKFAVVDTGTLTFIAGQVRTFVGLNNPAGGFNYTMLQDVN
ncbi:MAG: DUF4397 domain-containing protein [Terriglobales bacterium]